MPQLTCIYTGTLIFGFTYGFIINGQRQVKKEIYIVINSFLKILDTINSYYIWYDLNFM